MKVAFYASMKPPDDPVPSGDRTMARQLFKALELAGHEVELMSRMKCRVRSPQHLDEVRADAAHEVKRIAAHWRGTGQPDVIMAYHVYYKSPDLIGAELARQFNIPYVTVEASHAGKRSTGEWARVQRLSDEAIAQAAMNICFTARDREGLAKVADARRIVMLAPFVDLDGFDAPPLREAHDPVELVTVAMMLKGAKMESWRLLAEAVRGLEPAGWRLTLVGDGPMRDEVERLFHGIGQVRFAGQADKRGVAGFLARSDLFVWPGWGEAFGLVYLEAQAMGLPVAATDSGGVADVVLDGETGLLSAEGDAAELTASLALLIGNAGLRREMGNRAMAFVRGQRSLDVASAELDRLLRQVAA
jgi:glycosyltransferase involved in cell wall biosynthesis